MNKIVDKIFVINLDRDEDRLKNFDQMMKLNKWKYERFPAVYGKQLTSEQQKMKEKYVNFYFESMRMSEIGCLLSHVSLWEKVAYDDNLQKILIFEDDAQTHLDGNNVTERVRELHDFLEKQKNDDIINYDILYLGKYLDRCADYERVMGNVYKNVNPLSLHAYIITKEAAKKLLKKAPFTAAIDIVVRDFMNLSNLDKDNKMVEKLSGLVFHPSIYFQNMHIYNSNLRSKTALLNCGAECITGAHVSQYEQTVIIVLVILILLIVFMLIIKYFYPSFVL